LVDRTCKIKGTFVGKEHYPADVSFFLKKIPEYAVKKRKKLKKVV